jgi:putative PIN family toxin of toxin-antitoxin system
MRIVVDCNVVIAAGLTNGTCRAVLQWVLQNHTLILSEEIAQEYAYVIKREKFRPYWPYLQELTLSLCQIGFLVNSTVSPYSLSDKEDEKYLAAAEIGQASMLITGNKKHFPEDFYGSIKIMTPTSVFQEFLM